MRGNELRHPAAQLRVSLAHHVALGAAAIGDDGFRSEVRSDARHQFRHLPNRCRQHDQIGIGDFRCHILADAIDDAELLRMNQRLFAAPEADQRFHLMRFSQCQRERTADQSDAENNDFTE